MNVNAESWAKRLRVTFVCITAVTIGLAIAYAVAILYLYSFDRDPKRWSNMITFYAPSTKPPASRAEGGQIAVGSLIVRGQGANPIFATRHELNLAEIKPSTLHDCLLAAEDKRFYRHAGIDYAGLVSAMIGHFFDGRRLRGASTISNQIVGEIILADRSRIGVRAYFRKAAEVILTNVAERHFSKDDLLLAYVNNVPTGHLNGHALIGLSAATEALFGKKDPNALTLSEASTVAGMLNRPDGYSKEALEGDYRRLQQRRDAVLENLRSSNGERYSTEAIDQAKQQEIRFKNANTSFAEPRQFISYAYQQLPKKKPGLRVYLTLDPNLQHAAEASVREELDRFDRGPYGFYNRLAYEHGINKGLNVTPEDSKLQAALVALDPATGEILAMVGGRNPFGEFNRATQAKRPPGSVIKPFVYLYAVNTGFNGKPFGPQTVIDPVNVPVAQRYTTAGAATATVQLARSDNGAAVALASELGIPQTRKFIAKIARVNPVESEMIAIGAGKGMELSPLELAAAYAIFANDGAKMTPTAIAAIQDGDNNFKISAREKVQIVNARAAPTVARMLQAVIGDGPDGRYGTARMARRLSGLESSIPLGGKTGTSDSDLWFVAFTPRLIVLVWVGFDNNFPAFEIEKGFAGSGLPLQIWAMFMKDVKKYRREFAEGKGSS